MEKRVSAGPFNTSPVKRQMLVGVPEKICCVPGLAISRTSTSGSPTTSGVVRRSKKALQALSLEELSEIALSDEDTVMTCHFCRREHRIAPDRVRFLLQEKEARK